MLAGQDGCPGDIAAKPPNRGDSTGGGTTKHHGLMYIIHWLFTICLGRSTTARPVFLEKHYLLSSYGIRAPLSRAEGMASMADSEPARNPPPDPDANTTTTTTTTGLVASLTAPLRPLAKYKLRSHQTSKTRHLPLLQRQHDHPPPTVVFLGDSMFERMLTTTTTTTTGESPDPDLDPDPAAPWPPAAMLADADLPTGTTGRLRRVLNAGVGGDRVQNVAYRLVGAEGDHLPGLLEALVECHGHGGGGGCGVRLWVVHAGTNNLSAKKGLADGDRDALRAVVRALLGMPFPGSKVLVTGLFYRKDVPPELVDEANGKLMGMVTGLNQEVEGDRVAFVPAPGTVKAEEHLVDHVHLSLEGYRLWVRELFPAVVRALNGMEEDGN